MGKQIEVIFASDKLENAYDKLKNGKFEERQLYEYIERARKDIKANHECGIKLAKRLWPKEYYKYDIVNLWKYDLPNGWRIIYTVKENQIYIVGIILEWFSHKDYERRFGYG